MPRRKKHRNLAIRSIADHASAVIRDLTPEQRQAMRDACYRMTPNNCRAVEYRLRVGLTALLDAAIRADEITLDSRVLFAPDHREAATDV